MWFRALTRLFLADALYNALLRSPRFHRVVGSVHRQVRRIKHGEELEELGGTKLEGEKSLTSHFVETLKEQVKGAKLKK